MKDVTADRPVVGIKALPLETKEIALESLVDEWNATTVHTRDYYPTRFEYLFKDILCGLLAKSSHKDEIKLHRRALELTELAEQALDEHEAQD